MAKETKEITLKQLVKVLMAVTGATPATFEAMTEVKMNKTNNPYYGKIFKKQRSNVFINFNYANSVNKALTKEGKEADFVPQARPWGEKIPGAPIVLHKGEFYLEARFLQNEPKVEYFKDGKSIDKAEFETFLPKEKVVEGAENNSQGLEAPVVIRTFKITNIHEITVGGIRYVRTDI